MKRSKKLIASEFAARLVASMKVRGHVAGTNKAGVDVTALAKAAGATYEMARRYVEGNALPRPDKLERICDWLETTPSQLLYGDPAAAQRRVIHQEVLQRCIQAAREAERLSGKTLTEEAMAKLIAFLYEEALDGNEVSPGLIPRLFKLI